jgi:hypothetical protein
MGLPQMDEKTDLPANSERRDVSYRTAQLTQQPAPDPVTSGQSEKTKSVVTRKTSGAVKLRLSRDELRSAQRSTSTE